MTFLNHWLLTILLVTPALGAPVVLLIRPAAARWTALALTWAALALSLLVLVPFHSQHSGEYGYGPSATVQMLCTFEWIRPIHAQYRVAIDGMSYPFVVLTTLMGAIACAAVGRSRPSRTTYAQVLLFEATCLGTFLAFDLFLLFLFLALMLVPATALAGESASPRRWWAGPRLFTYLLAGLLCLLVVLLGEYAATRQVLGSGTFDLVTLASPAMHRALSAAAVARTSRTLFVLAMVAFLVRLAVVPLHTWAVELIADTPAALALFPMALIPATGAYGILRVALPLFPQAAASLAPAFAALGVAGILYAALCALAQDDLRRLVGYAGISTAGFVMLGLSVLTPLGANAAIYLMIFQALLAGLLLQLAGALYDRLGHASLAKSAGAAGTMPVYAGFWVFAWFALLVAPGLLGEVLVLLGVCQAVRPQSIMRSNGWGPGAQSYVLAGVACVGIVLGGAYVLSCIRRMFFTTERVAAPTLEDLNRSELFGLAPLALLLVVLGVLPGLLCFTFTEPAVDALFRSIVQ